MKKNRFSFLLLICNIFIFSFSNSQTLIDRIVAVVDKEIITASELEERVRFFAVENRLEPDQPELIKQILDAMISEKLILAQALIDSIEVSEDEVTRTLEQRLTELIKRLGSEQKVEQLYGKSINRIKREYRNEMRNQILIQKARQQHEGNLSISRREVEEFYETYKDSLPQVPEEFEMSHIFIVPKPNPQASEKTRKFLQLILDSLRAGGDFAYFARQYSMDAATAGDGGDLGWEKRGAFVREFEEVAFRLKVGEISNIVKTSFGYHIIQLLERRGESIHTRHILMKEEASSLDDSSAIDTLNSIRSRVLKGESFAELAAKYSEDEDTRYSGGNLRTLNIEELQPDFAALVKDMKPGEISEPLKTYVGSSYGYHIVLMRKRTPAHIINLQDDYRRVEQLALYMKRNQHFAAWVEELKKTIYVDVRL